MIKESNIDSIGCQWQRKISFIVCEGGVTVEII